MLVFKMKDIDPKSKFVLPPFEVTPAKEAPSGRPTQKLPTSSSFSAVKDAIGMPIQSKSK